MRKKDKKKKLEYDEELEEGEHLESLSEKEEKEIKNIVKEKIKKKKKNINIKQKSLPKKNREISKQKGIDINKMNITFDCKWKTPLIDILSLEEEDNLDDLIDNIKFRHPRNAYTHFCLKYKDEMEKKLGDKYVNKTNERLKDYLSDFNKGLGAKWSALTVDEKEPYIKLYEEEKKQYEKDLLLIRKYLFLDQMDNVQRPITAYQMFLEDMLIKGIDDGEDPKEIRKEARNIWKGMAKDEKDIYYKRHKCTKKWLLESKKIKNVQGIHIFIKKKLYENRKKNLPPMNVTELTKEWKKLSKNEKLLYQRESEIINTENERLFDVYCLAHGIKNKKPLGAYGIFCKDLFSNYEIDNMDEAKDIWDNLKEDYKEFYVRKNNRLNLAYRYKELIIQKKIKKIKVPEKPGTLWSEFLKSKKDIKIPDRENYISYWKEKYKSLSETSKKRLQEKLDKKRNEYKIFLEENKNKVFKFPKRPNNAFGIFISENYEAISKNLNTKENKKIIYEAALQWKSINEEEKEYYIQKSKDSIKIFNMRKKFFENNGFYYSNYGIKDYEQIEKRKVKQNKKWAKKIEKDLIKKKEKEKTEIKEEKKEENHTSFNPFKLSNDGNN